MMWALAINNKVAASLLLATVLGVAIITNFGERRNAEKINNAVTSLYEDRMVVEGYIFELSHHMDFMEEWSGNKVIYKDAREAVLNRMDGIKNINSLYLGTKLTPLEQIEFNEFMALCNRMEHYARIGNRGAVRPLVKKSNEVLQRLSVIQLQEARLHMDEVVSLSSFSAILSQLEMGTLIIVALIIQVLVFSSNTIRSLTKQNKASLN